MNDASEPRILLTREQRALVDALDGLGLGFVYTDGARVLFASHTYAQMVGYSVDQVLTMSDPFVMIAPKDRDRARAYTIEWMSGRSVAPSLEIVLETFAGEEKPVVLSVQRVAAEGGRFHVLVIVVDVAQALRGAPLRYDLKRLARAIADGAPEPFMILPARGAGLLMANGAARELMAHAGWSRSTHASAEGMLLDAGIRSAQEVLEGAHEAQAPALVMGKVDHESYDILVIPTVGGVALWWQRSDPRRAPAARDAL